MVVTFICLILEFTLSWRFSGLGDGDLWGDLCGDLCAEELAGDLRRSLEDLRRLRSPSFERLSLSLDRLLWRSRERRLSFDRLLRRSRDRRRLESRERELKGKQRRTVSKGVEDGKPPALQAANPEMAVRPLFRRSTYFILYNSI
jgi:hypothetical protein